MRCEICRCLLPIVQITSDNIIEISCSLLGVEKKKVLSQSRMRKYVEARAMISHLIYNNPMKKEPVSLYQIGTILGGKHHTTIIHILRLTENLFETDESFKQRFIDLHIKIFGTLDFLKLFNDTNNTETDNQLLPARN